MSMNPWTRLLLGLSQVCSPPLGVLLDRLSLVLLPVTNVVPPLLDRLPHPKAFPFGELGIGGIIRRNQQQRATSGATPLLPDGEIPSALWAFVASRSTSHDSLAKTRSLRPHLISNKPSSLTPLTLAPGGRLA